MINNNYQQMIPTSLNFVQTKVEHPNENDVLFGVNISKISAIQPGNLILRDLVESCLDDYQSAKTKQQKMKINRHIISTMKKKYGARFLSKRNDVWVLVDDQTTRDTISRNLRVGAQKKARRQQGIQQARSLFVRTTSAVEDTDEVEPDNLFKAQLEQVHRLQLQILDRMMSEGTGEGMSDDDDDSSVSLSSFALSL